MADLLPYHLSLSVALREKGDLEGVVFHLTQALKLQRALPAPRAVVAATLTELATLTWDLGRYARSVFFFTQLEKLTERNSLQQGAVLYRIGLGLLLSGRSGVAALAHARRILLALNLSEAALAPALGPLLLALGRAYYRDHKVALALSCFDEAAGRGVVFPAEVDEIYRSCSAQ